MSGVKYDEDKLRMDLITPESIDALVKVLTYGAKKYSPAGWVNVETWRYEAALLRHINAWRLGNDRDSESNLHHLAHAMANVMFLLTRELQNGK